ncbi:TKL/DRK protein kinase, variant 1 [Aphanomyces invadans]|uniref:TKL/DRK protein kinase, variant 1 n=1 Tax=Aphanomyces invadans TaxID=157072 RepID=A0A024UMD5_9STRA|nr:TKL/DRK protein kinase, variant 1 [Aphanomyces invadans]ETW07434.1 TKL/DRK protein kinase, variant 1 [Aphanomyces invadans]|eukprot:XP_008863527.1 TKL/DRK protein kinase, variant 1 [Aphanomyces invadans]
MLSFSGIPPRSSSGKTSDEQLFHAVDESLHEVRRLQGSISWVFVGFPPTTASGHDTTLCVLKQGTGPVSDERNWPDGLFEPKSLCYGLCRLETDDISPTSPRTPRTSNAGMFSFNLTPYVVSLCWKGNTLPFALRAKHTEFHKRIQDHLAGMAHLQLTSPDDLSDDNIKLMLPFTKRRSLSKRLGQAVKTVEISPEVQQAYNDIRNDSVPFNWMVAGFEQTTDDEPTKLILLETGMGGYNALSSLGGITSTVNSGSGVKYIYLRIDVPLQQGPVSKYILVTFHHLAPLREDDTAENGMVMTSPSFSSESKVASATNAYSFGTEIYKFFPHHIHFFASSIGDVSEEVVRDRVRRAVDSDRLFLRVVCILPTGEAQPAICVETPREATLEELKRTIENVVGLPTHRQRLVWFHAKDDVDKNAFHESQSMSQATPLVHNAARLQQDIGLTHGDKIHMDDMNAGPDSILAKLVEQLNAGSEVMSLPAERRHEVEYNVQAREKELKRNISATADLIAQADPANVQTKALQVQAEKLDSQQRYLDIPYDTIRLLEGKENELGCGKCATVYRGMWIVDSNKVAEVAVKVFRYARLTDKIMGDYTQEVAMLRQLKHPNIVLFIGACIQPKLMILTEYCARRSLFYVIHTQAMYASMPWKYKVRMMLDAARGVAYLHSMRIIHRDIKSHNLLVDDDWRVKVADFGISKVLDAGSQAFTQCGTSGWVAPEVLLDEDVGYTFKADNWSFGIVMWEMIAGTFENPFLGMAPVKFYNQALNGVRPVIGDDVSERPATQGLTAWGA